MAFTRHHVMTFASDFRGVPFGQVLARMYGHWDGLFGGITYTDQWQVTPAVEAKIALLLDGKREEGDRPPLNVRRGAR